MNNLIREFLIALFDLGAKMTQDGLVITADGRRAHVNEYGEMNKLVSDVFKDVEPSDAKRAAYTAALRIDMAALK